jgi:predicted HAD superfamily phosphohydrolase YqeG
MFEALDLHELRDTTVILDIDGTITGDGLLAVSGGVVAKVRELASRNKLYICSNRRDVTRNKIVASNVRCSLIETRHRKPNPRVLGGLPSGHLAQPVVVIGDKILVDGLLAWRIGARFIHVGRIRSTSERRLVNFLDDVIAAIGATIGRVGKRDERDD